MFKLFQVLFKRNPILSNKLRCLGFSFKDLVSQDSKKYSLIKDQIKNDETKNDVIIQTFRVENQKIEVKTQEITVGMLQENSEVKTNLEKKPAEKNQLTEPKESI